jgi:hypothetical protein
MEFAAKWRVTRTLPHGADISPLGNKIKLQQYSSTCMER